MLYCPKPPHPSKLTGRGIGWGRGLLVPSKLSYVAFQLQYIAIESTINSKIRKEKNGNKNYYK